METTTKPKSIRDRIGVLDGIRVFALCMVITYHYWQQSWLGGAELDLLKQTPLWQIPRRVFFSTGSIFVEVLLFLTGFCLFLPYAKSMFEDGITLDSPRRFYKKRFARIVPSAWFHIIFYTVFFIDINSYGSITEFINDFCRNIFLLRGAGNLDSVQTHYECSALLWTLSIELFFYLLFPWLVKLFKRWPLQTFAGMIAVSEAALIFYAIPKIEAGFTEYHKYFPTYLGLFGFGMMGAYAYYSLKNSGVMRRKASPWISSLVALVSSYALLYLIWGWYGANESVINQTRIRLLIGFLSAVVCISWSFSVKGIRVILDNPVSHFLAGISMNMYIWHFFFCIKLKEWRIPFYPDAPSGADAWPQGGTFDGHLKWQILYLIICWACTIVTAIATTYLIERPLARLILRNRKSKK